MKLTWHECYKTNIPELDNQHRIFFDLISQLDRSEDTKSEKEILKEILNCSIAHFIRETELLRDYSYPQLGRQELYQQAFIDKLSVSIGLFSVGNLFKGNILYFLNKWIERHITYENKGFDTYIKTV